MNTDQYIGIPFKDRGRTKEGIDCWGLFVLVYREQLGIELPSFSEEYMTVKDHEAISDLMNQNMSHWRHVLRGEEQVGDGIFMERLGAPHVGIIARPGYILHIEEGSGALLEDYNRPRIAHSIRGFYRYE